MAHSKMRITDTMLAGQVALVTAGAGGIGKAIALALAGAGADVTIADIDVPGGNETAEEIRGLGRKCLFVECDMMDSEQIAAMVKQAGDHFGGRLDILVNNAGGGRQKAFLDISERSWRRHIDLNLISMLKTTYEAAPLIVAGGRGGSIIMVSSIEGSRAAPNYAVSSACKAAMNGFTRSLALELSDKGIRVNVIAPDEVITFGIFRASANEADRAAMPGPSKAHTEAAFRRIPLGRYGEADECGAAALFLVSEMASYITGAVIPVDGGAWASAGWIRDRKGAWVLAEEFPED